MLKFLKYGQAAVIAAAILVLPIFALAQAVTDPSPSLTDPVVVDPRVVTVPLGAWLIAAAEFVTPILAAIGLWLIRKLPSQLAAIAMAARVDQLLTKAIDYAVNTVAGAAKDKELSINVGSEVVATALNYAVKHGPEWLINWAGGLDLIKEKIIARVQIEPGAALVAAEIPAFAAVQTLRAKDNKTHASPYDVGTTRNG